MVERKSRVWIAKQHWKQYAELSSRIIAWEISRYGGNKWCIYHEYSVFRSLTTVRGCFAPLCGWDSMLFYFGFTLWGCWKCDEKRFWWGWGVVGGKDCTLCWQHLTTHCIYHIFHISTHKQNTEPSTFKMNIYLYIDTWWNIRRNDDDCV